LEPVSIAAQAIWLARVSEITYNPVRARVFEEVFPTCSGYEYSFAVAQRKESSGFNTKRDPISDQARRPI
jgi:hypothetical protein